MAKIPKDLSDKDMMQGHEAEETLAETMLRQERQAEERAVRQRQRSRPPISRVRDSVPRRQKNSARRCWS